MRLAFRTRYLRNLCENQSLAEQRLGIAVAATLRARLADLQAAQSIDDLIAGAVEKMENGQMRVSLGIEAYLRLKANHRSVPRLSDDTVDWSKVSRIQITDIEESNG